MSQQHSLLVKTKGWLLTAGTIADVEARADWHHYTNNGRYAWAERNKIELTGIAVEDKVAFPMGWSVQETHPPEGYCYGLFHLDFQEEAGGGRPTVPNGLPWYCEIHDIWSTVEISDYELGLFSGQGNNEQYGPAFMGNAQIPSQAMYKDFEQIIAARSRVWGPAAAPLGSCGGQNGNAPSGMPQIAPEVRQQFDPLMHDNIWGSGEPIASLDLHHVRLYITNIDTDTDESIGADFCFCTMPPSLQPMRVEIIKPDFLSKMTMVRRSLDV